MKKILPSISRENEQETPMKTHLLLGLVYALVVTLTSPSLLASGDDEHHENETRISADIAEKVGIKTASVDTALLHKTITSYGVLATGPEQLSHMRARFSGLVTSVEASIGDVVQAGDLLAQIESDQSLKKYAVRAPISGTVVQRHANKGEVTKDQILFSIANFDTLWAEFRIYPAQRDNVFPGQKVEVISGERKTIGEISHVIPRIEMGA